MGAAHGFFALACEGYSPVSNWFLLWLAVMAWLDIVTAIAIARYGNDMMEKLDQKGKTSAV